MAFFLNHLTLGLYDNSIVISPQQQFFAAGIPAESVARSPVTFQEHGMQLQVRRWVMVIEHKLEEAGQPADVPLRKAAAVAFIKNPFLGPYQEDLTEGIQASVALGAQVAQQLMSVWGDYPVQAYGKGGIVGIAGEQEHVNALLTTAAATPLRDIIGGGKAWISSVTKVGGPGVTIDIPLASKDALYVRSHYNAMTFTLSDGPMPDEIAVIFAVANRGRINARVGGITHEDMQGKDGLI
jgi:hypothetical protein